MLQWYFGQVLWISSKNLDGQTVKGYVLQIKKFIRLVYGIGSQVRIWMILLLCTWLKKRKKSYFHMHLTCMKKFHTNDAVTSKTSQIGFVGIIIAIFGFAFSDNIVESNYLYCIDSFVIVHRNSNLFIISKIHNSTFWCKKIFQW